MFKKLRIIIAFGLATVMTGCSITQFYPRFPYWDKEEMIETALDRHNNSWLKELLADCSEEERTEYFYDALVNGNVNPDRFYTADVIYEMGVDINGSDYPIIAKLSKSASYQDVKYVLEKGADPNLRDVDGYSPLYYALENRTGQWEASGYNLAKLLVEYGAKPYPEMFHNDYEGNSERTVGNGAYRQIAHSPMTAQYLMKILLENGEESGLPASVEYAILGECEKSLNELKSGNTVSDADMGLISFYFGYFGTMEQYQELADFWGRYSKPPASCVAGAGNAEALKRLYLDKNPDDENSTGYIMDFQSPDLLVSAIQMNQIEIVKLLLSYEPANIDRIDAFGGLGFRVFDCSTECFYIFYDYCKENAPEAIDEEFLRMFEPDCGNASIHKYEIIDFLFSEGFDCRYVQLECCTAETINYLYDKGRPLMLSDLYEVACYGDYECVKAVVENGGNPNYTVSFDLRGGPFYDTVKYDGDTVLHQYHTTSDRDGAFMTYEELCESMEGNSGLREFCMYQSPETIQYILEQGVEIPEDFLGDVRESCSYMLSAENIRVLIENGANIDMVVPKIPRSNNDYISGNFTLPEYFEAYNRDDIVELLKEYD